MAFQGPGETRQSVSVTETATGGQFRFVMPGPAWAEEDVPRALVTVDQATGDGTLVVLSGLAAARASLRTFRRSSATHVAGRGARLIVDTSGPALFHLVERPREALHVLRMNGEEAEEIAGGAHSEPSDTARFAQGLVSAGVAAQVVVARGPDGSVLSTADGSWHAKGPEVPLVSRVGAGDSFVGAFTLGLAREWPASDCLRFGVAAAAAACTTAGTQLCDRETTEALAGRSPGQAALGNCQQNGRMQSR